MQAVDDPGRFAHNPRPKWEVPLELIEFQPSYTQRARATSYHSFPAGPHNSLLLLLHALD